jgi:peroxiredoxin 2/4
VCPTELLAFSERADEFEQENAVLLAYSVDSVYSHLAWMQTPRKEGGLGGTLNLPLLSDLNKQVSQRYGALLQDTGHTMRALYLIDERGALRHITLQDAPVGRSVDEVLRLVKGFRFSDAHGEVCPAGWTNPGDATIIPDPDAKRTYFEAVNTAQEEVEW